MVRQTGGRHISAGVRLPLLDPLYPEQRTEGKLSARGLRGVFLGIGEDRRAWLIFCPASPSNLLRWSRSAVFDETRTYDSSLALEDYRPITNRDDDHVEMELLPPKERSRGKRRAVTLGEGGSIPEGTPSDEDLHLQEYEQLGQIQVLQPPSAGLPLPDDDDDDGGFGDANEDAPNQEGALPLWDPSKTGDTTSNADLSDIQLRVRELERLWDADASTPSSTMSLDDLGALLDQTPEPRTSTPPPAPTTKRKERAIIPAEQLRRSTRTRARMAHMLSEELLADEDVDEQIMEVQAHVRARAAVAVLGEAIHWAATAAAHGTSADGVPLEPQNLKQAKSRPETEWARWRKAMDEELSSLLEMGTWTMVDMPANKNIVGCRWVYKLKLDRDRRVSRYKARLVAQGYTQREGIDFKETFAPVARLGTIRLVISVALALGLVLGSIDIKTAYLNGTLYEEVYMAQPPEYDDGTGRVCLLRRAIYGLKQAERAWFDTLKARLLSAGYTQVESEPCLFVRFGAGGPIILAVYVDDIVIAARNQEAVEAVKAEFGSWYKLTDNGELSHILGMKVEYDPEKCTARLSQTAYIDGLMRKYSLENEAPLRSPMTDTVRKLGPNTAGQSSRADVHDYAALVGSLLWVAQGTRPDIAFAVGHLARFMSNPGPAHFLGAKGTLRYLGGTRELGLFFTSGSKAPITGWSDSDHATDPSTRRSVSGYIFKVYGNTVSWRSRLQGMVAVSSTEAEYVALSEASREAKWLRSVLGEIGIELNRASDIYTDSKGAEAIAADPADHPKTKHIEVHHHLVRRLQERKEVCVGRVHTDNNPADKFTKALTGERYTRHRDMVGLVGPSGNLGQEARPGIKE